MPVNPVVEVGLDVDAGAVDNDDLLPQQATPLNRPVDHHLQRDRYIDRKVYRYKFNIVDRNLDEE